MQFIILLWYGLGYVFTTNFRHEGAQKRDAEILRRIISSILLSILKNILPKIVLTSPGSLKITLLFVYDKLNKRRQQMKP